MKELIGFLAKIQFSTLNTKNVQYVLQAGAHMVPQVLEMNIWCHWKNTES